MEQSMIQPYKRFFDVIGWFALVLYLTSCTPETMNQVATAIAPPSASPVADTASAMPVPKRAEPVANLLRYVPASLENRRYLTFGDYDAWLQSWQVERPADLDALAQLHSRDRDLWLYTLGSQIAPPQTLIRYLRVEAIADSYGFDFFSSHQFLEAGSVPDQLTILTTSSPSADIDAALTTLGYQASQLANGTTTLYSIRQDYEMNLASETQTGMLGELNRIAIGDNTILIGRATATVAEATQSAADEIVSLSDMSDYQALLHSFDAPELADVGALLGLIVLGEPVLIDVAALLLSSQLTAEKRAELEKMINPQPPLPLYSLAGFATYRSPTATFLAVHTVFLTEQEAAQAAEVLPARMAAYISTQTGEPLPWSLDRAFHTGNTVVVVMRADETPDQAVPLSWLRLVNIRDTAFLVVE